METNEPEKGDKEQPRSIRFPRSVWKALDTDAKRCGRSSLKQLEQLLRMYLKLPYAEIDKDAVASIDLRPLGRANDVRNWRPSTQEEIERAHPPKDDEQAG